MKTWQSGLTAVLAAMLLLAAAACTSGGNVDDNDGAVSDTSITESSSGGAISEWMEDVKSDLGIDSSDAVSSTTVSQ